MIVAPLISGTLGEDVGWHYGFGAAGVVMVIGLLIYLKAGPWLPPDNRPDAAPGLPFGGMVAGSIGIALFALAVLGLLSLPGTLATVLAVILAAGVLYYLLRGLDATDRLRVTAVLVLVPVMAVALLTNQQIFNAYLVWADQQFQLTFFGRTIPTSWMITIDAAFSFSMLVAVAWFWKWRADTTGREPDELGKMIIGSLFSIVGGLCLVIAAATQGVGQDRAAVAGDVPPVQLDRLRAPAAGQPRAVQPAGAEADQRHGDRHLLPRVLPRQPDRRPRRRVVLELGHHDLLAVPRRHRGGRAGGVRGVQAAAGQAADGRFAARGRGTGVSAGIGRA